MYPSLTTFPGDILADLAMDGSTSWDISPFRAARFATATPG